MVVGLSGTERGREPEQGGSLRAAYGSDVIVDLLTRFGVEFAAMNPGASFRGLHDSIVNYGGNRPALITAPHEKLAVGVAHGYAKASGRPMAAILHDTVGLLHGAMGIFYAYTDRAPILVLGGGGPMAADLRRPHIDWIHTAALQGNAVRDYTKWDDQPFSVRSFPESFARAYRIATMEPQGPVYLCFDTALQEEDLSEPLTLPDPSTVATTRLYADPGALDEVATLLARAERPILIAGFVGRDPQGMQRLVELAETASAGVIDLGDRLNFPSQHALNQRGTRSLEDADLVVALDVHDLQQAITILDRSSRATSRQRIRSRLAPGCKLVEIGFNDLHVSGWVQDSGQIQPTTLSIVADAAAVLPMLTDLVRRRSVGGRAREGWRGALETASQDARAKWTAETRASWDLSPVSTSRLAAELWEVVRTRDFVLTANTLQEWTWRLWNFDRPYQHPGQGLGTATQIGISLGVALAHKGSGRLVVDVQPDGDLMYDLGSLWIASYHRLPLLVVMYNNRAYYNDWLHQERIARHRGRDVSTAYVGMELDQPAPDFAAIARGVGWYAEGPLTDPGEIGGAIRRATEYVEREQLPALVDVVTQRR